MEKQWEIAMNDNKLRVGIEVVLEEMQVTPLLVQMILLSKLRDRDRKNFDIAVKAIQEADNEA